MTSYAIHAAENGTAVVIYERDGARIEVESIERLPAGLDPAAEWLQAWFPDLPDIGDDQIVIDADGLGRALWDKLKVRRQRGWRLYDRVGLRRQELANALLVAMSDRRVHIQSSEHEDAMRKAMLSYRRVVADDGVIGGELVVALALAVTVGRPRPALFVGAA